MRRWLWLFGALLSLGAPFIALVIRLSWGPLALDPFASLIHTLIQRYDPSVQCKHLSLEWSEGNFVVHLKNVTAEHYRIEKADVFFPLSRVLAGDPMPHRLQMQTVSIDLRPSQPLCKPEGHFMRRLPGLMRLDEIVATAVTITVHLGDKNWVYPNLTFLAQHRDQKGLCTILQAPPASQKEMIDLQIQYHISGVTCFFQSDIKRLIFPLPYLMPQWETIDPLFLEGTVQGQSHLLKNDWSVSYHFQQEPFIASICQKKKCLSLKNLMLEGHMSPTVTRFDKALLTINDSDILLRGEAQQQTHCLWKGFLEAKLIKGPLSLEWLPLLWPEDAGVNAREWILGHFEKGKITCLETLLNYSLTPELVVDDIKGKIALEGVTLNCAEGLPPIQHLKASSDFTLKGFDIVIHDGLFLEQKLTKGHLTIAPLVGLPYLTLAVDCKGALLPLFKGLDKHLSYFKKIPLVPSSVKGKSCVHLEMKFPLLAALKMEQIQFSFDSLFEGMSCRIKGIPLKMTRGLVKAKGNPEGLTVIADSALNATASRIRWTHDFKKDQDACLTVKSSPEPSFLESLIGEKIESYVSGSIPLEIKCYPLRQAEAIQVKAVLDHNTVKLPWIQLKKSAGLPLSLAAMVHKKKKKGWHMKVSVQGAFSARFEGEASEKGILERLEGHLKARQSYSCSYKHSPEGTFLWLRGALFDLSDAFRFASQASSPTTPRQGLTQWALQNQLARIKKATPVSSSRAALKLTPKEMLCLDLQCERLILKPGIVFSDIKGKLQGHTLNPAREWFDFSNIRWIEGRLTGQLLEISKRKKRKPVKKNRLDLQVMPGKSGHTNIVLNVQNVGAVFYSLGITNRLKEGTLHMEATQDATGLYKGICRFYGIYTDAPVLAKLLAMSSPAIFLEFLSSRLAFNTVHCELRYHEGQLLLDRIVGQGVNLGISGRGKIDFDKNTVDMEGVVIPIYWLNTLFSYVPIIGWVFGGDNGVLSAEFSLKGSIDSPKINMLPLSIFKLGFMKSLFENTPDFNIENRPGILKSSEEPSEPAENAEPSEEDLE